MHLCELGCPGCRAAADVSARDCGSRKQSGAVVSALRGGRVVRQHVARARRVEAGWLARERPLTAVAPRRVAIAESAQGPGA